MFHNFPSYRANRYQSRPTESYDGGSRLHAVTQHLSDPTAPELFMPNLAAPSMSKKTTNTSLQCSPMGSVEGHGNGTNMVEPYVSQGPATSSGSQHSSALADDERFVQGSMEGLAYKTDRRMRFVWRIIAALLDAVDCCDCPRRRELWLRIIEGDDDDDLWLWVDGDEDCLTEQNIVWHWKTTEPTDWLSARSALRRRIARKRYPPVTARNEKVQRATPEQRTYVIAWLIASSKGVEKLFAVHGRAPPRTPHIADILSRIICEYRDAFPSRTDDWASTLTRSKEDGCICSPADCDGMREWFDMMVWLEDISPVLVVGDEPCVRCRSLLKSWYKVIVAKCTVTLHVSLVDTFYEYCRWSSGGRMSCSPPLGPTAKLQAIRMLEPLMKKHGCDMRFSPPVNRYPDCLRPRVAELLCGSNPSCQHRLPSTGLPDNILDGADDPWVVLGIIASASYNPVFEKDTDSHDEVWHGYFSTRLRCSIKCFDMPVLPRLSSAGFSLCHALDQDDLEERSFGQVFRNLDDDSDWVKSDQDGRQLRLTTAVMVAVITFLRGKNVDLHSCRRCQVVCTEFFAGIPSTVGFDAANSDDRDNALGRGLSPPLEESLELGRQEPLGMEASTSMLRKPALSKDEICSRLIGELRGLRQRFDSIGLDIYNCLQLSDSGSKPRLGESILPRHLPGCSISSSSTRSKSDKVEEIKHKLLSMLRELNLPYEHLPWYTLEKDLKKHGCTLVNWPVGVPRKRGNKGIQDLNAVEVSTLYEAITHPDESRRPRIHRRPSTLTVVPVQPVNHTSAAASRSKRPVPEEVEFPSHSSKRIRFRDMSSKFFQQHSSNPQADEASGA